MFVCWGGVFVGWVLCVCWLGCCVFVGWGVVCLLVGVLCVCWLGCCVFVGWGVVCLLVGVLCVCWLGCCVFVGWGVVCLLVEVFVCIHRMLLSLYLLNVISVYCTLICLTEKNINLNPSNCKIST